MVMMAMRKILTKISEKGGWLFVLTFRTGLRAVKLR